MVDSYGGLTLPVPTTGSAAPGQEIDPVGDQPLRMLADFLRVVVNAHATEAWQKIYPGDGRDLRPIRAVYLHDPNEFEFNKAKLPALFVWRIRGTFRDRAQDWREAETTFRWLWVPPPETGVKHRVRTPFYGRLGSIIDMALERGIDPAWWVPVACDTDRFGQTLAVDPSAVLLPKPSSLSPTSPTPDGPLSAGAGPAPRSLTVTWSTTPGATWDTSAAVEIDCKNLFGISTTLMVLPPAATGGTADCAEDVFGPFVIRLPAALATGGTIQVGCAARAGRGRALEDAMRASSLKSRSWQRERIQLEVLASDGRVSTQPMHFGVSGEIVATDILERDPAIGTEDWDEAPGDPGVGLRVDVTNGGFTTAAELPTS